jgi:hypothetical protein
MNTRIKSAFPLIGLSLSLLLSIYYTINFVLSLFGIKNDPTASFINETVISFVSLAIIVSIRFILVVVSDLKYFRKSLDPLILLQLILLLITLIFQPEAGVIESSVFLFLIFGTIIFIFFLWFIISLSETEDNEVVALPYLKIFCIIFLLMMIIRIIPGIIEFRRHKEPESFSRVLGCINGLEYILLIPFFFKNYRAMISNKTNNSF